MKYAAIYLPEFPVATWLRAHPATANQAAVVLEGSAPLEHVYSRNQAAARLGIARGMSRVQAETSGEVCFVKRSMPNEQDAFAEVLKLAETFSPRVEVIASPTDSYGGHDMPAACLLLDRSGTEKLIGTAQQFAARLNHGLLAGRFAGNIASADNAEACLLLARSYAGITCVGLGEIQQRLARLPVSSLRIDAGTLAIFYKWGIRTLGQLAALPQAALISRIGQQGQRLQSMAMGTADHLLVAEEPTFTLAAKVELDTPVELLDSLLFIISPMLEQLVRSAIERACALRSLTIELVLDKAPSHHCRIQPALPSTSRDLMLKLLNLQLQAHPPTAPITGVRLTAEPARPQTAQKGLFQAQFPDPDKLDLLVARLRSIAGQASVGSPELKNSYCPDELNLKNYKPGISVEHRMNAISRMALRCMRPAPYVKVATSNGVPNAVFWEGIRLHVAEAAGPWQASGYWWEARRWQVDEWDALIAQPSYALRLSYEYASSRWSIAGMYD